MRSGEIFRFELAYLLRRVSTWIYAGILFAFAFLVLHANADPTNPVHANAPAKLAQLMLGVGLLGILVTAALFGDAAVRGIAVGMDPLLFTTPTSKTEYLGGRFLAALVVNAIVVLAIPLGLFAATLMPYLEPEAFGPFRVAAYVQPLLLFTLPNVVLVGAILFTVAVLARQVIPVYLAAIGFFISYLVIVNEAGSIEKAHLAALVDPLGIGALQGHTQHWTTAEQNTRLLGFAATLLGRFAWVGIAAALLAFLHRWFRFEHQDRRWRAGRRARIDVEVERSEALAVPRVAGTFGWRTTLLQILAVLRRSLSEVVLSRWFGVVVLLGLGLALLFGWDVGETPFDTSMWPATALLIERVLDTPLTPITFLLIAVYAGELVWKERDVGVAEIADATPAPESALLLGRFLALVVVMALFQTSIMLGGILTQALQGYSNFEIGLYLRILLGLHLADLVLLAMVAMTIHVIVNHKYVAHLVTVLACIFPVIARETGLLQHHLLLYGKDPGWTYSDLNGFGPFIGPFVWFKLYWAGWALVLALVARLLWVRGREPGMRHRLRVARQRVTGGAAPTAAVAIVLILAAGGFVYYNTNVLNQYRAADQQGMPQAEYERRYGRFEDLPQPVIAAADMHVEIYPEKPSVDLRGSYHLMNRSGAAIDSVHVSIDPELHVRSVSIDRTSTPVLVDDETGYRILALERSLEPGDSLRLAFDVAFQPHGFPNHRAQTQVVRNGAHFDRRWLPFVGYQPVFELSSDKARRRFGLEPKPPLPAQDDLEARRYRSQVRGGDMVQIDAVLGTSADQIAVTPGVLRRTWTENGRRYFHYRSDGPTGFGATVFSARYAVLEDRWNDVALRIYYHPSHAYVLDRMVRSMKASLEYFTREFGPYPDAQMQIIEFPRYGGFGHAHPHTAAFSETAFLSRVRDGEVDLPFYGTAHEIAHQWWGGQVHGAPVRGASLLTESLANYSAIMVTEKIFGPKTARQVYDFQMWRYLNGRSRTAGEVPLVDMKNQPFLAYRKGVVALYTLRERMGEERVNMAVRRYLEKHRGGGPPYPTSLDLYAELQAVTPDSLQPLLRDLFEEITLWNVAAERAVAEPAGDGAYSVTLDVVATKVRADSIGNETEVPMNDLVDIGVFALGDGKRLGEPIYLQQHAIQAGAQTIRITVPQQPARAGIDPYRKLIDRTPGDNVVEVEAAGDQPR